MFAVKGWSVDASALKPQTAIFEVRGKGEAPEKPKNGKKRKRSSSQGKQNPGWDDDDVGKLWERHVEGKDPPKKQKKNKSAKLRSDHGHRDKETRSDQQKRLQASVDTKHSGKTEKKSEKLDQKKEIKPSAPSHRSAHVEQAVDSGDQTSRKESNGRDVPESQQTSKLTPMQSAMRQKLVSARFRHLNETLYTAPSSTAQDLFNQNPDMFEDYHAGFRQQVSVWPENPLDTFITIIRHNGKTQSSKVFKDKKHKKTRSNDVAASSIPLPRTHGTCTIADLGCGDARLASTLKTNGDTANLNLKILSFDLHSPSPLITKADISNLPVADGSVNVAIFCLALMGTNWMSFIEEAYRILHWKGELWVAEIKSRFGRVGRAGKPVEHSVGGKRKQVAMKKAKEKKEREQEEVNEQELLQTEVDGVTSGKEETDVTAFIDVLRRRGFVLKEGDKSVDLGNKMFVKMEFIKLATPTKGKGVPKNDSKDEKPGFKPKLKFLSGGDDDPATEDEAKVLKPCLYKIR